MSLLDDQGLNQKARGSHQDRRSDPSLAPSVAESTIAELAQCRQLLADLTRSLTQHEYEDVLGRVKGTWSRDIENKARAFQGLQPLPQSTPGRTL